MNSCVLKKLAQGYVMTIATILGCIVALTSTFFFLEFIRIHTSHQTHQYIKLGVVGLMALMAIATVVALIVDDFKNRRNHAEWECETGR
jgi:hypothetical protein